MENQYCEQMGQRHGTIQSTKANKWINATEHLIVNELQNETEENRKINNKYKAVQGKRNKK